MAREITIYDDAVDIAADWYSEDQELEVTVGDNLLAKVTDVKTEDEARSALQAVLGEVGLRLRIVDMGGS